MGLSIGVSTTAAHIAANGTVVNDSTSEKLFKSVVVHINLDIHALACFPPLHSEWTSVFELSPLVASINAGRQIWIAERTMI